MKKKLKPGQYWYVSKHVLGSLKIVKLVKRVSEIDGDGNRLWLVQPLKGDFAYAHPKTGATMSRYWLTKQVPKLRVLLEVL